MASWTAVLKCPESSELLSQKFAFPNDVCENQVRARLSGGRRGEVIAVQRDGCPDDMLSNAKGGIK